MVLQKDVQSLILSYFLMIYSQVDVSFHKAEWWTEQVDPDTIHQATYGQVLSSMLLSDLLLTAASSTGNYSPSTCTSGNLFLVNTSYRICSSVSILWPNTCCCQYFKMICSLVDIESPAVQERHHLYRSFPGPTLRTTPAGCMLWLRLLNGHGINRAEDDTPRCGSATGSPGTPLQENFGRRLYDSSSMNVFETVDLDSHVGPPVSVSAQSSLCTQTHLSMSRHITFNVGDVAVASVYFHPLLHGPGHNLLREPLGVFQQHWVDLRRGLHRRPHL
ncbi:hypothetical protein INR49_026799 [Caranx melampygus]|nr:hypothetical protein INR49_026799 [Caranx melampygus]